MQKLSKILLALALAINLLSLPTFADEFDPVADLATDDLLLDLDLPLSPEENTETSLPVYTPPSPDTPAYTAPSTTSILTTPPDFTRGSGGAIEKLQTMTPSVPQATYANPTSGDIASISYAPHAQTGLTPTGPEAIWIVALILALTTTWFFRHKFSHA